jgi:predicted porin
MRKGSLMLALSLAAISFPVPAQNTVTLYGLINDVFDSTNNAKSSKSYKLLSGEMQGSRWSLKGTEDLVGGLLCSCFATISTNRHSASRLSSRRLTRETDHVSTG